MQPPPFPGNESKRLRALYNTNLLDSAQEERFDRLTRLACNLLDVPYALVSLLDSDRQWFKSKQGLDVTETSREVSFCGHTILQPEVFEVTNAAQDPRFSDNPLVTGAPFIRFYAGAPVYSSDGYALGTLCLIDTKPKQLSEKDRQSLLDLAACVSDQIESQAQKELRKERALFSDGPVFTIIWSNAPNWPVKYVSANVAKILGYTNEEICHNDFRYADLIHPSDLPRITQEIETYIANGTDSYEQSYRIRLKSGEYHWFYDFTKLIWDSDGEVDSIHGYLFDHTQQRESDTALLAERRRLADIIEGTRVGTWEWNVQTGETSFNERWADIVGYSLAELAPISIQTWLDLAHPEDLKKSGAALERCFSQQDDYYDFESRMKHKLGHWVWVHDRGKVISWTEDKLPLLMSGTHADITDRKNAEIAVKDYSDFQNLIFENLPAYLFVKDKHCRIVSANQNFLANYPEEMRAKVIGSTTFEEYSKHDAEKLMREDRRALEIGYSEKEERIISANGNELFLWISKIRFEKADGEPYILCVATDITERKNQEAQRDELRTRLSLATKAARVGIWEWDVKHNHLDWDEQMYRLYGYTDGERPDNAFKAWLTRLHPDDKEKSKHAAALALSGTSTFDLIFRALWPDQSIHYIQVSAHLTCDQNGRPSRLIGTGWDITEQKVTEQALTRAKDQAEIATKAKSEFLANMSHEIRTPINGVLGMVNMALKNAESKEQKRRLQLAQHSATTLLTVINDILDFSKIEAGHLAIEYLTFDLLTLLSETISANAISAQNKGIKLYIDATEVTHTWVKGDPNRIKQILNNLLSNAIKFTNHGEVILTAKLEPAEQGYRLLVAVKDTGIGIKSTTLAQLFNPFTQADSSTTRNFGGTGLGLSIVKQLCEIMGGHVSAESELGVGSTFTVDIALLADTDKNETHPITPGDPIHALIIDDVPLSREIISKQLDAWEHPVVSCKNYTEAKTCIESNIHPFELILISQTVFNESKELIQLLLNSSRLTNTYSILLADSMDSVESIDLATLPFSECIAKPITPSHLFDAIMNCRSGAANKTTTIAPLKPATQLNQTPTNAAAPTDTNELRGNILLVEDNLINQEVASALLEDCGFNVQTADNGKEAIHQLNNQPATKPFDLVFMDCQMPEMDGYQATQAIRSGLAGAANKNIPIIALTANAMSGDAEKCIASGMNDHLAKPIDLRKLEQMLQQYLAAPEANPRNHTEPIQPTTGAAVWNKDTLISRVHAKQELIVKLTNIFLKESSTRSQEIETLKNSLDTAAIVQFAHRLKGSGGSLCCPQLTQTASEVEAAAKAQQVENLPQLLQQLAIAIANVEAEFKAYNSN